MSKSLKSFQASSLTECNIDELVDINTVKIDAEKSKPEKYFDFLRQIKNPYLFRVGNVAVKVVFSENGNSFQQQMESLIRANLGN